MTTHDELHPSQGMAWHRSEPADADAVTRLRQALVTAGVWRSPPGVQAHPPWYITVLQAGSAWLAALLLLPFLAWFLLGSLDSPVMLPAGIVGFGLLAGVLGWTGRKHVFLGQMGAALGLAAGLMALGWAFDRASGWWMPLVLAVFLYLVGPNVSNRLLSGLTLAGALYMASWRGDSFEALFAGSLSTAAILGWGALVAWAVTAWQGWRHGEAAAPLAWAFVLAAGFLTAVGTQPLGWIGPSAAALPEYWQAPRVACALLPAAAWLLACQQGQPGQPGRGLAIGLTVVLLALVPVWQAAPGLALAVAWLVMGFSQSRVVLMAVAALGVLGYLGRFYYQLDVSLLHKAGWLGAAAVVLGLTALVFGAMARRRP